MSEAKPFLKPWSEIPIEPMSESISRQYVNGTHVTVARIYLKKGAVVPRHSHPNEQISQILSGSCTFHFDDHSIHVATGGVLVVPPNVPHEVTFPEDTIALDIFAPIRQDWLTGEDAYLRR